MVTLALMFMAYWLPSLLAFHRRHKNRIAILAINFFFGWTVVAWIVTLIWACTNNTERRNAVAWG